MQQDNQQGNQQVQPIWTDLQVFDHIQRPNVLQEALKKHQNCSVLYAAFENVKKLAKILHNLEPNCDLWKKMLFEVNYNWIYHNQRVFRIELEKYSGELISYVPAKIHPNDVRWMRTYVNLMTEILRQQERN